MFRGEDVSSVLRENMLNYIDITENTYKYIPSSVVTEIMTREKKVGFLQFLVLYLHCPGPSLSR